MGKRVTCPHCDFLFYPEEGVSLDDCPVCGRTVEVKPAPAPLPSVEDRCPEECEYLNNNGCDCDKFGVALELEDVGADGTAWPHRYVDCREQVSAPVPPSVDIAICGLSARTCGHEDGTCVVLVQDVLVVLPRLLSLLTPPPDAALREAVEFSAEARCSRLARGILRIGKKLRVMRADMASQTDALIAAMYAINDAGILMPDEVLNYVSTERAVQAPRPSSEQHRVVRIAVINADLRGDTEESEALREAFPGAFEGEAGRG